MANPKPSFREVDRMICAPGGPFEMEEVVLHGRDGRIWKHVRDCGEPHIIGPQSSHSPH
jgi:hypothetical protein